jgi:hypothetical protein
MDTMKNKPRKPILSYTRQQIWQLKVGKNLTLNKELAFAAAKKFGKRPIDYISKTQRITYLLAYPEMGQKVK